MKKVLLSGFGTFGSYSENSSEILVSSLTSTQIPGIELRTIILPVTFQSAFSELRSEIESFKPDAVISLGLASNRSEIELEKVAINFIDSDVPDNDGVILRNESIIEDGATAYFSTLPLERWRKLVTPFPVGISYSAGTYVCNSLMYQLLHYSKNHRLLAGFIHLPPQDKNMQEMRETMLLLLETLFSHP